MCLRLTLTEFYQLNFFNASQTKDATALAAKTTNIVANMPTATLNKVSCFTMNLLTLR
jgi:hypothetical protein